MKIRLVLVAFICLVNQLVYSQNDSTNYQKFYADFVRIYKDISKPPLKNYYEVLSKSCNYSFNPFNPRFARALKDVTDTYKVSETVAIDTLFKRVFTEIKQQDLWINFPDIYKDNRDFFDMYNNGLCPCYTSKVTNADPMEKLLKVAGECNVALSKDTAFVKRFFNSNGKHTMKDFLALQRYFDLYLYINCPIVNYHQNETIENVAVYDDYFNTLSLLKRWDGENVIRYFRKNMFDSLAVIFPGYKKYLGELKKAMKNTDGNDVKLHVSYNANIRDKDPEILVHFYNHKSSFTGFAQVEMKLSGTGLFSTIISFKYTVESDRHKNTEEIIIKPVTD